MNKTRKSPRLGTYDYSTSGRYFITICTHGKKHILSHITSSTAQPNVGVGVLDDPHSRTNPRVTTKPTVGVGVPDDPHSHTNPRVTTQSTVGAIHESPVCTNKLTAYGKIVDDVIKQMNDFYEVINVDKYVIMPNHIHMLLSVNNPNRESEGGTSRTPSPTNSVVSKFVSSFKRFCNKEYGHNIWQRSYHDHIIRDEKDYVKIWGYIDTNVIRWTDDCFYSE